MWFGAALGLVLNFYWLHAPKWVSVLAYVAVGWVGVITIPQMFSGVGVPGSVLVMVGGALYTIGALVYAVHWPNPFPRHVRVPRDLPPARRRGRHDPVHRGLARRRVTPASRRTVRS